MTHINKSIFRGFYMNTITYNLAEDDVISVKKIFFDYSAHKSIISEIVRNDPNVSISDTRAYSDYVKLMAEYDSIISKLIEKYSAGKYTPRDDWEINFDKKILMIYNACEE